ncbi:portal protein [Clostridia bacterium]|nr:portal protein [Clostridia bacterium]
MNPFSRLFHPRDQPTNRSGSGLSFLFASKTASGQNVNEHTAMQVSAVYACVRLLSEAIASLPLHVYKYNEDGGKERVPQHPLFRLLYASPNSEMTSFVFREILMSHLLLYGNAYAQLVRNGHGQVIAMYPLLPNKMEVSRDKSGALTYTYYRDSDESGNRPKSGSFTLHREDVLHIPGLGFDGLIGYSPIAMARNAIGMAQATEQFGATFFANNAQPGGILESPSVIKDHEKLNKSWMDQFTGGNAHRIAILEEGLKFHQVGIPNDQAQFLESRKFQNLEIARIFRVPASMIGDLERATYSNAEMLSLDFVKFTLNPWVVRWEQSMNQALILPSEQSSLYINFNLNALLRADYATRMRGYSIGIQNGFLCPDDVRSLEEMDKIPGGFGQTFMANGNMVKLQNVGAAYVKARNMLNSDEKASTTNS